MKTLPRVDSAVCTSRWQPAALLRRLALTAAVIALALHAPLSAGQTVQLTPVPMSTSTVTTVKPNLMYVLDDSGSMGWDFMPDPARNFNGKYGYNSSQCNGVYYNPDVTYLPPVNAAGGPLNATATTFSAAYKNGYVTGAGTTNLSTGFTGGSGSGSSGIALAAGPAFYYTYSGNQTTEVKRRYADTNSDFYKECVAAPGATTVIDGAAVNTRFTLVRLAAIPTTNIVIAGTGAGTITITGTTNDSKFSSVKVGGVEIMSSETSRSNSNNGVATRIAASINACTLAVTGSCGVAGYSASVGGANNNVITISGPAAAGATVTATRSSGNANSATTAFPAADPTVVSSITVGGTLLWAAGTTASGSSASALAADVQAKITLNGYSATRSGSVVTVTGPAAASTLTPVITKASGGITLTTSAFPEATPAKLQNFANWYSYYSHRMLMMKTGSGLAFKDMSDKFRVGFITMNNNVSPGIVEVDTFSGAQRTNWYNKLYAAVPSNSTPLREILSRVGQYYANKFGTVTKYTATITVGGTGATTVNSVKVGSTLITDAETPELSSTSDLATAIADRINAVQVSDYGASAVGNVVTILGPAGASGSTPAVDKDGNMTFALTSFVATTTTSTLNGITPSDPVQYSCQQNFTILSTDGYWNGPNTYNLSSAAVGQQDGVGVERPFNDGSQAATTYRRTYVRETYSKSATGCSGSSNGKITTQRQVGTCDTAATPGTCAPTNWSNTGTATTSICTTDSTPGSTTGVASGSPVVTAGAINGPSNTLADVAMYYYKTDLRDGSLGNCTGRLGTSVCDNNVFTTPTDDQTHQHMTTFTLGLGARGKMIYSPTYLTDTSGDFFDVRMGSTASATVCTWQTAGTVCNWPVPVSGTDTTIDDLWHAAVNGRGAFFSATDPASLASSLANAIVGISSKVGAAAAAATSSLNPVAGNNFAYVASYTTQAWTGNLEARGINTATGRVAENAAWCLQSIAADTCSAPSVIRTDTSGDTTAKYCARPGATVCPGGFLSGTECWVPIADACTGTMPGRVADTSDTRTIHTAKNDGLALVPFDAAYRTANPSFFASATLAGLSQWPASSDVSVEAVSFRTNAPGDKLVNYLRGRWGNEFSRSGVLVKDQFFRNRSAVIGDALESQPVFLGAPNFSYPYPGYAQFKSAQSGRSGTVFMGTNDGMLHAFAASGGAEVWAYIPSMVVPNLWRLADQQYAGNHVNFVNGTAVTTDICTANCANTFTVGSATNPVWKTILVAGLNGGGRGYYALDVTNPDSPSLLWEFTTTAGFGKTKDNDLGFSFGVPVVTQKADGTWVVLVTSGYDNGTDSPVKNATTGAFVANTAPGSGRGYLFVLNAGTGAIISKIDTGVGSPAVPSGLAKIAGVNTEPAGNKVSFVYGGDLQGNLWRFDINSSAAAATGTGAVLKLALLSSDAAGTSPQPITTTPQIGLIETKRVVFIATGKYLETADLSTTQTQTLYAIKDDNAMATLAGLRTTLQARYLVANSDGTATRLSSGSATGVTTPNAVNFATGNGWYVDLPDSRERANIDAELVLGTLVVPTIVPSATDCSPGGTGWLNYFDYKTGGTALTGTGAIASRKFDSPIVGFNVMFIDGKPVVAVVTATNPTPEIQGDQLSSAKAGAYSGTRVLWRELLP